MVEWIHIIRMGFKAHFFLSSDAQWSLLAVQRQSSINIDLHLHGQIKKTSGFYTSVGVMLIFDSKRRKRMTDSTPKLH